MGKSEISWKGRSPDGIRREVYAERSGKQWQFYARERRYDKWQLLDAPPLEDWLELLDAVRRRINRRLLRPEEEGRVKKTIEENFPGTPL